MKLSHALTAVAFVTFASSASAQQLKPGLWEVTNNIRSGSGQTEKAQAALQQQMAGMPPEQRKKIEKAMADQGMKMAPGGAGGMAVRTCMTREMVERNEIPTQQGECRTTKQERSGNTTRIAFTCTNPPSSGEGEFTMQSPEAYRMKMAIRTNIAGKADTMNMDAAGKWLSADCGSIKPPRTPNAK